jgi:hypothetical protein
MKSQILMAIGLAIVASVLVTGLASTIYAQSNMTGGDSTFNLFTITVLCLSCMHQQYRTGSLHLCLMHVIDYIPDLKLLLSLSRYLYMKYLIVIPKNNLMVIPKNIVTGLLITFGNDILSTNYANITRDFLE